MNRNLRDLRVGQDIGVRALREWTNWVPATPIQAGIGRFVEGYRDYYMV